MTPAHLIAAGVAGVLLAVSQDQDARQWLQGIAADLFPAEDRDQTTSGLDAFGIWSDPENTWDTMTTSTNNRNRSAFLAMIRFSEGTDKPGGYFALFGWPAPGRTFTDTTSHPARFFEYTDKAGKTIKTSAAGAYQITFTTFKGLVKAAQAAGVFGFGPEAQDWMALELIRQRGALADIDAGRFAVAVEKVRRVWASLPGSGWNQPERSFQQVAQAYTRAGGFIA